MTNYRVHGITDETDTCEVCGKVELRRVVMLAVLDADGNTEEIVYAGTTCAARKLRTRGARCVSAARVRDAAAAAARVYARAGEWANEFAGLTLNQFIAVNVNALLHRNDGDTPAALADARVLYADLQREITAIQGGSLAGTRFEENLPTF